MLKTTLLLLCFSVSAALAQQQASPLEQALGAKMMREMNDGLQCSANVIVAQQQLAAAQAEVKRLTDKYEPKPVEPPK